MPAMYAQPTSTHKIGQLQNGAWVTRTDAREPPSRPTLLADYQPSYAGSTAQAKTGKQGEMQLVRETLAGLVGRNSMCPETCKRSAQAGLALPQQCTHSSTTGPSGSKLLR